MNRNNKISKFCRSFRIEVLELTLKEFSDRTGTNIKTLSAFETGRIKNIDHLFDYIDICNSDQKMFLMDKITEILKGK